MLGSSKSAFVACLLSLCFSGLVNGAPYVISQPKASTVALAARATPTTVQTTNTVDTASGPMVQTCTITLTPDSTGGYQEVKTCTMTPVSSASAVGGAATATDANAAPEIAVIGQSSVAETLVYPSSAVASGTATSAAAGTSATANGAINNDSNGDTAAAAGSSASVSSSAAAVTKTATSDAAVTFTVPGRHIMIIPVGLVIFCVLTGIMLLVIFYMHFERMKYRRAFRNRKLAEQGAAMGYGGMGKI